MAYQLKEVTVRADNSPRGMAQIGELWADIESGKLPLLFDSAHQFQRGLSPVSRYSAYEEEERGAYDLTILAVQPEFFAQMEAETAQGIRKKYDAAGDSLPDCTRQAWQQVWADQKTGIIRRAFTTDFESSVPAEYTKDGKAHCYLYIALKEQEPR